MPRLLSRIQVSLGEGFPSRKATETRAARVKPTVGVDPEVLEELLPGTTLVVPVRFASIPPTSGSCRQQDAEASASGGPCTSHDGPYLMNLFLERGGYEIGPYVALSNPRGRNGLSPRHRARRPTSSSMGLRYRSSAASSSLVARPREAPRLVPDAGRPPRRSRNRSWVERAPVAACALGSCHQRASPRASESARRRSGSPRFTPSSVQVERSFRLFE